MARIAVGGWQHETNTFAPSPATLADFEAPDAWPGLTRGEGVIEAVAGINLPLAGAIEALRQEGHEIVPLLWASATPSAPVTREAWEHIASMMLSDIAAAGRVDGAYLDLHGAMVAEHLDDPDGALLRAMGEAARGAPVVASLDLHANVTPQMLEQAAGLVAYRTYPHVDMAQTGARAARYLSAHLRGERPARAMRQIPFLVPLPWQCTEIEPAHSLYRDLARREGRAVELLSFAMGFPLADIPDCGPSVFAYGRDEAAVDDAVADLAERVLGREGDFAGRFWAVEEAVAHAVAVSAPNSRPVILADTQDNPGGGANSDATGLLAELLRQGARDVVAGLLYDPEAAMAAVAAGVGAEIDLALGGRSDGKPLEGRFRVLEVGDGRFTATGPFYKGSRMQLGPMALLGIGGLRIATASRKQQAADRAMFRHLGIEPEKAGIFVLKSSVHFRADFQNIASEILVVRAPGSNVADPAELVFRKLRPGVRLGPNGRPFTPEG